MKRATLDQETANFALERSIERPWFRSFITGLIIFNAVILGILTYRHSLPGGLVVALEMIDHGITYIFAVEILLKLVVYRLQFFRVGWNWFDFIVVGISLIPGGGAMVGSSELPPPGPITRRLQSEYFAILHGEQDDRHHWLTPVRPQAT